MSSSPDVVLLRSADTPDDAYVDAFAARGRTAVCEPVLTFAFPHQKALGEQLARRDAYAALIATSPRVSTALERLFTRREDLADRWAGTPAYAVGPKTAARLRAVGLRPRGQDAGTAEALAAQIVEDAPPAPLLFLSGSRRRDTLPEALRAAGIPFNERVVYETRSRTELTLPPPETTTWLAFFSPSGLEAVEQSGEAELRSYRIAAIGPTTAGALRAAGHDVEAVAETPSPEGLCTAILRVEETVGE